MSLFALAPALGLGGCVAELLGGLVASRPLAAPPGEEIIVEPDGAEIVIPAPPEPIMCHPRARHFRGFVDKPCAEIGKETDQ